MCSDQHLVKSFSVSRHPLHLEEVLALVHVSADMGATQSTVDEVKENLPDFAGANSNMEVRGRCYSWSGKNINDWIIFCPYILLLRVLLWKLVNA